MRLLLAVLLALLESWSVFGQGYTISTIAGGAVPVSIKGTSASLQLSQYQAIAADRTGNIFFADQNTILRIDSATGILSLAAGSGTTGSAGDGGPAVSAQLFYLQGIALDSAGNLYIADTMNNRIRKVANNVITTVAGTGVPGFSGDGEQATNAELWSPSAVAVDSAGNLFIADNFNNRIRKVSNGVISTVAGNGTPGSNGDNGPALNAELQTIEAIAVDAAGNLYIADAVQGAVRKVSGGVITTVAAKANPLGIAVDSVGNLYIADGAHIRQLLNGVMTTVAGSGRSGFSGDNGPATVAQLNYPNAVTLDGAGNLYISDAGNNRIREISGGLISTIAGNGAYSFSGDNGPATGAELGNPYGVAVDSANNVYISDTLNNRIRQVSGGTITSVAGNGAQGFSGDGGPAASAELALDFFPGPVTGGIAVDSAGNLFIADTANGRIREVSHGVITTVAGNGGVGSGGDNGPALDAQLRAPEAVAVDSAGNIYIADTLNSLVRKVSSGVITTIAGNGTAGFSGDGGPATAAQLHFPVGLTWIAPAACILRTASMAESARYRPASSARSPEGVSLKVFTVLRPA